MLKIKFRYKIYDEWIEQICYAKSVAACKKLYNLDNYDYEIISIEECC